MPKLNKLFAIFQDGPTGGPVLGESWPFLPETPSGYRVRLTEDVSRGATELPIDVYAGPTGTESVGNGVVTLNLAEGTRIGIGEHQYTIEEPVRWSGPDEVGNAELLWDPTNRHGLGIVPPRLDHSGLRYDVTSRGGGAGEMGVTLTAAGNAVLRSEPPSERELLQARSFQWVHGETTELPSDFWTNSDYDAGALHEGYQDAPNHWHGIQGQYIDFHPSFNSLTMAPTGFTTPVRNYAQATGRAAGHLGKLTNLIDETNKKTLVDLGNRGPILGDLRTITYYMYSTRREPQRWVRAVPDFIDPDTLTFNRRTIMGIAGGEFFGSDRQIPDPYYQGLEGSHVRIFEIGEDAPLFERRYSSGGSRQLGYWSAGFNRREYWSDDDPPPELLFEFVGRQEFYRETDDSNEFYNFALAKNCTDFFQFVSLATWSGLHNGAILAINDYFNSPVFTDAAYTRRLHALRTRLSQSSLAETPGLPQTANVQYQLGGPPPIDRTLVSVAEDSDDDGDLTDQDATSEFVGHLYMGGLGFVGVSTATEGELGTESDEAGDQDVDQGIDGPFTFVGAMLGDQIFPTEYLDSFGEEVSLRLDVYTLAVAGEGVLSETDSSRNLVLDRSLVAGAQERAIISIFERIIPPSDDTRTVWGVAVDSRSRKEVVAGLDDTGNVEQSQTVERAEFEVRDISSISAGMYVRSPDGRLWEIVGVADARSRRNIILSCERVYDRRRQATTFPRFAVPIRRV